jgi:flagellar hook-length control protein FliK
MTQTLALSLLQTGIQSMPLVSHALPEFDMALATATAPTPVAVPVAAPELSLELSTPKMALTQVLATQPEFAARIPAEVVQLIAANEKAGEVVPAEAPVTASISNVVVRPRFADIAPRKSAPPEQAALPEAKMTAAPADDELFTRDENDDAPSNETTIAKPEDAPNPAPAPTIPTATIIALPLAEKPVISTSARAAPARARAENSKIDAGLAATLSPATRREAILERQTAKLADDDAPAKPVAVEPPSKSVAFESALAFSNSSAPVSDIRGVAVPPAHGLHELSGAQGVAERHLNLARDSMWLDQLATDIVAASDQTDHISFRLMPAHLGRLDVDLITSDAGLSVNIATSTEEASQIVAAQQPSLIESLQAQGIRVADTQVNSGNEMSRQNQSQRNNAAHHLIETALNGADEPVDQNDERPDGRFA